MKFLHDDKLNQWTTALTDVPIGHSRILQGRLEAYSMKRVTSDKKYAAVLGEKYVEQIHQDQEWAANHQLLSTKEETTPTPNPEPTTNNPRRRKRSQSAGSLAEELTTILPTKRPRSCSLDEGFPVRSRNISALGDFHEQGTRRLMTDLVLTLNAAFTDYDFASIKPSDFAKMTATKAIRKVNESLSEWAASNPSEHNLNKMWDAIDQCVQLKECDVYVFTPSEDSSFLLSGGMEDSPSLQSANVDKYSSTDEEGSGQRQALLWSFNYMFVNKHLKRILLFTCSEFIQEFIRGSEDAQDDESNFRFVPFSDATATNRSDFDLDPESTAAGGIPYSAD